MIEEQITKRINELGEAFMASLPTAPNAVATMREWRSIEAREIIRLMRWAQTLEPSLTEPIDCSEYPGMRGIRILGPAPLTMPPPEWTPETAVKRFSDILNTQFRGTK